jgi:hypothetical protein
VRLQLLTILGLALLVSWPAVSTSRGQVAPAREEVQTLVSEALDYLQKLEDERLGAKCLAAMAFLKTGAPPAHPTVQNAVRACRTAAYQPFPIEDVYSNGLAVIFLCEMDPRMYEEEIERFLGSLYARQKPHGGWGYNDQTTGDTSQTQYAVLGMWTAHRAGIRIQSGAVVQALGWLMRTQDPSGVWGYQGQDSGGKGRVPQTQTSVSMLAAGLGSTLMCAHMLGLTGIAVGDPDEALDLPPAVSRVAEEKSAEPVEGGQRIDRQQLEETLRLARQWMTRNFTIETNTYNYYYLYALERYKSFEELVSGQTEEAPEWYRLGFELLKERRNLGGGWVHSSGEVPDTAFAILFLVRSTQKSLRSGGIGEGLLVGGRGLPQNVATATVHRGRLIAEETAKSVDELIQILEDRDHPQYQHLLEDPRGLVQYEIGEVTARDVPRLRTLVRGGDPLARLISVQALAQRDSLDEVPTLIFALSDPDVRVVLSARDTLRLVSRRLEGYGLPDDFTDRQRFDAIEDWKAWYRSVRPGAVLE